MNSTFKIFTFLMVILIVIAGNDKTHGQTEPISGSVFDKRDTNPLFKEEKVKNYLPHMTWLEVENALKNTDMVIIPVGSIEQHGKHLPLCTDLYSAIEVSKLIAQETDILVAPAVFAGLSKHHLGFPGSITLSPQTFEAVVFESALCLIQHGFKKIIFYNGHGGNTVSVQNVIQKINQTTSVTAVFLNDISVPPDPNAKTIPYDWHAGEGETSSMLYLTNGLVDMSRAEKPVLTFPPIVQKVLQNLKNEQNLESVMNANLFRPKDTDKLASSREMSNNGVFTSGDPNKATVERGKKRVERFVKGSDKIYR